jgi:hypothetical protein
MKHSKGAGTITVSMADHLNNGNTIDHGRGPTVRLLCHGVERRQLQDGAVEPISVSTIESGTHGLSYREPVSRKR